MQLVQDDKGSLKCRVQANANKRARIEFENQLSKKYSRSIGLLFMTVLASRDL